MSTAQETRPAALATVGEVAQYLRCSKAHVYRTMERGDLPYTLIGAARRIRWADVEKMLAANTVGV